MHHKLDLTIFNEIVWYTPCKSFITMGEESPFSHISIIDFFVNTPIFFQKLLASMKFYYLMYGTEDKYVFLAEGINDVLLLASKKNKYTSNKHKVIMSYDKTLFCPVNINFINKIIDQTDISMLYSKLFLDILFNEYNIEKVKYFNLVDEYDECIIMPDVVGTNINKKIKSIISKFNNKDYIESNDTAIHYASTIKFNIIVKPDSYEELKQEYRDIRNNSDVISLLKKLKSSPYITPCHTVLKAAELLQNNSVEHKSFCSKFENIYKHIVSFYQKIFGIKDMEDCISVQVSSYYPRNLWLNINVRFRNIYDAEYNYVRIVDNHSSIRYSDFISCMLVGDNLDDKYIITIKKMIIEKYGLKIGPSIYDDVDGKLVRNNIDCLSESYKSDITSKSKIDRATDKSKYLEWPNIFRNKQLTNFTVKRVLPYKIATTGAICSYTLCVSCGTDNYLFTIVPNTLNNINSSKEGKKANLTNEFISILKDKLLLSNDDNFCNEDLCFYFLEDIILKYKVEIIKLNCYDCKIFNQLCERNNFERVNYATFKNDVLLPFIEDNVTAKKARNIVVNNFRTRPGIIVLNILYNIHKFNIRDNIIIGKLRGLYDEYNDLNKKSKLGYYIQSLLYSDMSSTISFYDTNIPFMCVDSEEYLELKGDDNFRRVIWFVGLIAQDVNQLDLLVDTFISIIKGKETFGISKKDYILLLNALSITETKDVTKYFDNYLANVYDLYEIDGNFNKKKKELDMFVNKLSEGKYVYVTYHYHNGNDYNTLHLHLINRDSTGVFSNKELVRLSRRLATKQFTDERSVYETNNYHHLSKFKFFRHTFRANMIIKNLSKISLKNDGGKPFFKNELENLSIDDTRTFLENVWDSYLDLDKDTLDLYSSLLCVNPNTDTSSIDIVKYNRRVLVDFLKYCEYKKLLV